MVNEATHVLLPLGEAVNLAGLGDLTAVGPAGIPTCIGDFPEVPWAVAVRGIVIVPLLDTVIVDETEA